MKRDDRGLTDSRHTRERLQSLALSRARVTWQLSAATAANHRAMLERALAAIDAEAEGLTKQAAGPDTGTAARIDGAAPHGDEE